MGLLGKASLLFWVGSSLAVMSTLKCQSLDNASNTLSWICSSLSSSNVTSSEKSSLTLLHCFLFPYQEVFSYPLLKLDFYIG